MSDLRAYAVSLGRQKGYTMPREPQPDASGLGWWVISGEDFQEALRRVHAGEDPEMVYAEWYANSEVETDA